MSEGPRPIAAISLGGLLLAAAGYERWCEVTDRLLAPLSPGERAAVLGGNAAHFYRLDPARIAP